MKTSSATSMMPLPGFSTDLASLGRGGSGKIVGTSSRVFLAVWQGSNRFWRTLELGGAAVIKNHSPFSGLLQSALWVSASQYNQCEGVYAKL